MKKALIIIVLCLCSFQTYSQDANGITLTKELICRGAAISVAANIKPVFDMNIPKSRVIESFKGLVKDPIKDSPSKAYDLFKANKTRKEVTEILYNDFMKLDEKIVMQYLINTDFEDF